MTASNVLSREELLQRSWVQCPHGCRGNRCHKQRDHEFHRVLLSIQFGICSVSVKSTTVLFSDKKIYSSAKHFMKKFLASIKICSRL